MLKMSTFTYEQGELNGSLSEPVALLCSFAMFISMSCQRPQIFGETAWKCMGYFR